MLRVLIYDTDQHDICDYCRKSETGKEIIALRQSGRTWTERNVISIHTACLLKQLAKHDKAKASLTAPLETALPVQG